MSSLSVRSEPSSSMSPGPLGVRDEGKIRRAPTPAAMTHPKEMDAGERRRQREAMKRRMSHPQGLPAGLLEKWEATTSTTGKFEFLKAFMLDENMTSMHIEAEYKEYSEKRQEGHYIELPLHELEEKYNKTEEGRRFLRDDILAKQTGREHPQAKGNAAWRLYKIYEHGKEISANVTKVGTKTRVKKSIGKADTATRKKLAEVLTSQGADHVKGTEESKKAKPNKEPKDSTALCMPGS
ncbi:unnamed protein product [Symbiodinium sp. CCMP2592]|nr:unnamed protein product [Symbiodinium sp. CCMP2592]